MASVPTPIQFSSIIRCAYLWSVLITVVVNLIGFSDDRKRSKTIEWQPAIAPFATFIHPVLPFLNTQGYVDG